MCECYAWVSELDPRRRLWEKVVPDGRMPLKYPLPHVNGGRFYYEGDVSRLSAEQLETLAGLLAEKFGLEMGEVRRDLGRGIMPVLAEGVSVWICEKHVRCLA